MDTRSKARWPSHMLIIGLALAASLLPGTTTSQASISSPPAAYPPLLIIPDQMELSGDVSTKQNTVGHCTADWLSNTPEGSIMLGVNPESCNIEEWNGGSATAKIALPDIFSPTVYALKISWPDRDGKGIHSFRRNRTASISLDGLLIWGKRTTRLGTYGDYYAAEHEAILTTLVVRGSETHTLNFSVPANTAWDISRIELTAYPYPKKIQGIGYSPYRDCQYPDGPSLPSANEIDEDMWLLSQTSNAVRTYASTGLNYQIPALARAHGLKVFAGAWIDYDTTTLAEDNAEIQALIELANTENLTGAIVGNEYYLRHRTDKDVDYLLGRIQQFRNGISDPTLPVMTGEIDNLMFDWVSASSVIPTGINPKYRPILDEVDVVLVHIYPFWSGLPIDGAASFVVNRYQAMQALMEKEYPDKNKRVIIGETGWPSGGNPNQAAVPSPENQKRYMLEFLSLAESAGVDYLYFDAFDERWKILNEGTVGQNWGYSYSDRTAKYNFYGLLIPSEQLFRRIYLPGIFKPFITLLELSPDGLLRGEPARRPMLTPTVPSDTVKASADFNYPVYTDWLSSPDGFVPNPQNGAGIYECDRSDPIEGDLSIRNSYMPIDNINWGGVDWLYPENNYGDKPDGKDLRNANKLTFYAKGEVGGEKVNFFVGGIGDKSDLYPESLRPEVSTGFISLTESWQKYTIDLRGKNLTHMIRGFGWVTNQCANPDGIVFLLDDIRFEYDDKMPPPPPRGSTFSVYTDAAAQDNHYVPTNWMGDGSVPGRVSLNECWTTNPHSGETAIQVKYTNSIIGWAGIYWVHPANNWGDRPGGYDLTGAKRLTFWARSEVPNTDVTFIVGGIGCSSEPFPDSLCPKIEQVKILSTDWTQYSIELPQSPPNLLGRVVGGFGWVLTHAATFYVDDIIYEFDSNIANRQDSTSISAFLTPLPVGANRHANQWVNSKLSSR